jgi:hypothetical protein
VGKSRDEIFRWLAPPPFKEDFERARESREAQTAQWLFYEPQYKAWMSSRTSTSLDGETFAKNLLWVCGKPGFLEPICNTIVAHRDKAILDGERQFLLPRQLIN